MKVLDVLVLKVPVVFGSTASPLPRVPLLVEVVAEGSMLAACGPPMPEEGPVLVEGAFLPRVPSATPLPPARGTDVLVALSLVGDRRVLLISVFPEGDSNGGGNWTGFVGSGI